MVPPGAGTSMWLLDPCMELLTGKYGNILFLHSRTSRKPSPILQGHVVAWESMFPYEKSH